MSKLLTVESKNDIPKAYRKTPVGLLLEYHNLNRSFETYDNAQLLIGTCMDNRIWLRHPNNFAFTLRTGGANLRANDFHVSYAIGVAGIRYLALIGHTQCGMIHLHERMNPFIEGLRDSGWNAVRAREHFNHLAPLHEIDHEVDFTLAEARRLSERYPEVLVAPMIYRVEDHRLYLVKDF